MRTTLGILCLFAIAKLFIAVPSGSAQVDRVAELERKVGDLELECKVLSGDVNQLKFDREYDSDSIVGISDSVDDLRTDLDAGTAKIGKLRTDVDELSKRVSDLEDKLRK
jgi:polyhydroxyalkanoate synthesis regulator phasin